MKKVVNVSIGRVGFTVEEDAYYRLRNYLERFEATLTKDEAREVMEDVELRVAEILMSESAFSGQVVDLEQVDRVIGQLGEVESEPASESNQSHPKPEWKNCAEGKKKLMRDPDNRTIAGVCGGLSIFTGIDDTLLRILFAVFTVFYGFALWVYIILWLVVPKAKSVAQKLQMRGIAPTAENIRAFNAGHIK